MAKNGTEFEIFVKAIYEEILAYDGYDTVNVEHDVKVFGKSGQPHQMDVYWEFRIAGITHRVAVECKEYTNTISVGKVRDFYGALEDIGNIHGIFVTTQGYQSGAIKYAEHKNISLKVISKPAQEDIYAHQGIKEIHINARAKCISNISMNINFDMDWILTNTNIKEGDEFSINALKNEIKIFDSNFNLLSSIHDLEKKLPREPKNTHGITKIYKFSEGFIHVNNSSTPPLKIKSIIFKYDTYTFSTVSKINYKLMAKAILTDIITGESHLYKKRVEREYI